MLQGFGAQSMDTISLKALVDKQKNKVLFVECDSDFVDVLFSFFTMPVGKVLCCARNRSVSVRMGCIDNLYDSVEKIDSYEFRHLCKQMLLGPLNAAESHCNSLKLKLDTTSSQNRTKYFVCPERKFLSFHKCFDCPCCDNPVVNQMSHACDFGLKPRLSFIITDDLHVIPSTAADLSLFSKLGVEIGNSSELTFVVGVNEVVNFLMRSLVSETPLTETLLKSEPKRSNVAFDPSVFSESEMFGDTTNEEGENISVKLMVSKSKNVVCYAKAGDDFVSLLFSFLCLPLGFVVKQILDGSFKRSIDQLYRSVRGLDELYFKSNYYKEMLLNPKLVPGFCYKKILLGVEEASYYYVKKEGRKKDELTTDKACIPSDQSSELCPLGVIDPKALKSGAKNTTFGMINLEYDKNASARGFFNRPINFTVTDNLVVRQLSPIFELSILNKLNVPFTDVEERIVQVGKKEALQLLVASFVFDDSVLTNVFLRDQKHNNRPKKEES